MKSNYKYEIIQGGWLAEALAEGRDGYPTGFRLIKALDVEEAAELQAAWEGEEKRVEPTFSAECIRVGL